ncbi:tail fiber assembly protein [Algicola sagamiensis]|uniref:tail fiber assembly protein n=1 Tax=Algicola sagamiensis TaxID=163869 RepID=UPI000379529B|nr:tail fiber assembly protein [Algicola sagamiensis]
MKIYIDSNMVYEGMLEPALIAQPSVAISSISPTLSGANCVIDIDADEVQQIIEGRLDVDLSCLTRGAKDRVATTKWRLVRTKRDQLLSQSDYTQIADYPLTDDTRQAWSIYRQALRDLPNNTQHPDEIVWPQAPE